MRNGYYVPKNILRVVAWPKPDAHGNGEEVWVNKTDSQGRVIGRELARDTNGEVIRLYSVPEGFRNVPTSDNQSCYVYYENDDIYRTPTGEAVTIEPGQAVVFLPDGNVRVLTDEYEQYLFERSHDFVEQ